MTWPLLVFITLHPPPISTITGNLSLSHILVNLGHFFPFFSRKSINYRDCFKCKLAGWVGEGVKKNDPSLQGYEKETDFQ